MVRASSLFSRKIWLDTSWEISPIRNFRGHAADKKAKKGDQDEAKLRYLRVAPRKARWLSTWWGKSVAEAEAF